MRSDRHRPRSLSSWAAVRIWENATRERLRRQNTLWLHGWCIGLAVLVVMAAMAHLQRVAGSDSLALRYLVTLGTGYLSYLFLLRWWAGRLVGEEDHADFDPGGLSGPGGSGHGPAGAGHDPACVPAGGGDFGGGGAEASFEVAPDDGSAVGELASGALEAAGAADEAAVVVVPVMIVFLGGLLVVFGCGALLMLYFGWEVLLAVAVEVAFGYAATRAALRIAREGWLTAAVRLTWKPLLGALACAVLLGALIDVFVPQAQSLPQAVRWLRQPH